MAEKISDDQLFTVRLECVRQDFENDFGSFLTQENFINLLERIEAERRPAVRKKLLEKLYKMISLCRVPFDPDQSPAYYRSIVKRSDIPDIDTVQKRMFRAVVSNYLKFPTPDDYLSRLTARLSDEADIIPDESLRLRILKRFIHHADWLKGAGYSGKREIESYVMKKLGRKPEAEEIEENIDDNVFSLLQNAKKEQLKPNGKYGLLKLADSIGRSQFRSQGATLKELYLLAFAYDMRFYPDGKAVDPERDIVKNLFRDYYTNNVLRFLSEDFVKRPGALELDPPGHGINYKNFAEMIFLYFLAREGNSAEKIEKAFKMIEDVQKHAANGFGNSSVSAENTSYFRKLSQQTSALQLSENDFCEFILRNYDCGVQKEAEKKESRSLMMLQSEQRAAGKELERILDNLDRALSAVGLERTDCNYGIWFADLDTIDSLHTGEEDISQLKVILQRVNDVMTIGPRLWTRAENGNITRSVLLTAFYYYYNAYHEMDTQEEREERNSFHDLYHDFKTEADPYLERAGYQEIDSRNFFDLLMTLSSCAYLNF